MMRHETTKMDKKNAVINMLWRVVVVVLIMVALASMSLIGIQPAVAFVQPSTPQRFSKGSATMIHNVNHHCQIDEKFDLRLLLVDHYDSFTYNLVDMLGQHCLHAPVVIAADSSPDAVQRILQQQQQHIDGIILSPGPGNPDTCGPLAARLVTSHPDTPVLGVCLGHQILGTLYGGTCTAAPTPVHGQVQGLKFLSSVQDDALWQGAFDLLQTGVNSNAKNHHPWHVTRYHSLHVTNLDQTCLISTAVTDSPTEDVVMAFRHALLPHYGVQFHPESVGCNHGWALLRSFCQICQEHKHHKSHGLKSTLTTSNGKTKRHPINGRIAPSLRNGAHSTQSTSNKGLCVKQKTQADKSANDISVLIHKVPHSAMEPWHIVRDILGGAPYRFWLDTADERTNAMSVLGEATARVEYWGKEALPERQGVFVYDSTEQDGTHYATLDILTYLEREYPHPTDTVTFVDWDGNGRLVPTKSVRESANVLPFSYRCGHVGFLGYEVRHDTTAYLTKLEGGQPRPVDIKTPCPPSLTPTAALMRAERSFVYHHDSKQWYLVGLARGQNPVDKQKLLDWMTAQSRLMQTYVPPANLQPHNHVKTAKTKSKKGKLRSVQFVPSRSRQEYNQNFETCLEQIRLGESYELCLTNKLEASVKTLSTPLDLYHILRRRNPAPFSAFFDWNSQQQVPTGSSFAICCSSPERFVSVSPGSDGSMHVEAKPIKGTCARVLPKHGRLYRNALETEEDDRRAEELRLSVKNRAENLMIVDLLRNDLSRLCRTGSVHVAKLMNIESFATVHQMVSTIRGTLDTTSRPAVSTLRACFPGGSMTGAPKLRTMEILDDLEEGIPRGPYSGCLGYIGANGAMDMNIVIRTAVVTRLAQVGSWQVSVGAGGAITILSESEDEYNEMILKASAVVNAVEEWTDGGNPNPADAWFNDVRSVEVGQVKLRPGEKV